MLRPKLVSLICPVCRPGDDVREFIADARSAFGDACYECIVVDDHSTDGSCHDLPKDVLVVRTENRAGPAAARHLGATHARGDVLIWSEPGRRFLKAGLERVADLARSQDAIFLPRIGHRKTSRIRYGGQFVVSNQGVRIRSVYFKPAAQPALYGGVCAMKQGVYRRLAEWPQLPDIWRYCDEAMSLMTWFVGVPTVVSEEIAFHRAPTRKGIGRPQISLDPLAHALSSHILHAAFFSKTYSIFWKPLLERGHGVSIGNEVILSAECSRISKHLQRHAVRSERKFFRDVLGVPFPDEADWTPSS